MASSTLTRAVPPVQSGRRSVGKWLLKECAREIGDFAFRVDHDDGVVFERATQKQLSDRPDNAVILAGGSARPVGDPMTLNKRADGPGRSPSYAIRAGRRPSVPM
jgi:hypothetical protein